MTDRPIDPPPGPADEPAPDPSVPAWDEEPTDAELYGECPDPYAGPPDGPDAWLADLSGPELEALADELTAATELTAGPGQVPAGFTRRDLRPGAVGFAAGGALDALAPDPVLAGFAQDAVDEGLGLISDDELVGLLCAARRLSSWQAAIELAAVSELDSRRQAQAERPGQSRTTELVSEELAAALTLTGRAADTLLGLARGLFRLPAVTAALSAGLIDRARAEVFATELSALDHVGAASIAAAFWRAAADMTTGQLRAALRSMVLAIDPDAARRRAQTGRTEARVEAWQENSGNSALGGRELPPAEVIAADKRIDTIAQSLRSAGAAGTLDQLRAAVFTALLLGRDPAAGVLPDPPGEVAGLGPVDAWTCRDLAGLVARAGRGKWCVTLTGAGGRAVAHACARALPGTTLPGTTLPGTTLPGSSWLASLRFSWLERGDCTHQRQTPAYRPSPSLRHLIEIRQRTCAFPGCRRQARRCDLDHAVVWDAGGRTGECNLAPSCKR